MTFRRNGGAKGSRECASFASPVRLSPQMHPLVALLCAFGHTPSASAGDPGPLSHPSRGGASRRLEGLASAYLHLPLCLGVALAPLLGQNPTNASIPYLSEIVSASASAVGEVGDYLKCKRLVDNTSEPIANYALIQFTRPVIAGQRNVAINYGVCLPLGCTAPSLVQSFKTDLPPALAHAEERLNTSRAQLALAESVLQANASLAALPAVLRRAEGEAAERGWDSLAAQLADAARLAAAAGTVHQLIELAEATLERWNTSNATAWAAELKEADEVLTHGLPQESWSSLLQQARAQLQHTAAGLNASVAQLSSVNEMATTYELRATVGSQESQLTVTGVAFLTLLVIVVLLTTLATVRHTRPRVTPATPRAREPPTHPSPADEEADASAKRLAMASPLLPADEAPVPSEESVRTAPPPEGSHTNQEGSHAEASHPHAEGAHGAAVKQRGRRPSFLDAFSLPRNWKSLCAAREDRTMACLDGLRCWSMAWVIFGHTLIYSMFTGGTQFLLEMFPKGYADTLPASVKARVSVPPDGGRVSSVAYQLLPGAFFAVDTFFWMGGLLTAVALIKQMRKLGSRWWRLYPVYAVGRWVRLTPLVIVTLLWVIGVQEAAGDGPFWGTQQDRTSCVESWWVDLLYVQNILQLTSPERKVCLGHLWYLANDMQFFLSAPFVVFPYVTSRRLGWAVVLLLIVASTVANVVIAIDGHYTASTLFDSHYFTHMYIQPYIRAQVYLVGIALAFAWDTWREPKSADHAVTTSTTIAETFPSARLKPETSRRFSPQLVWALCLASAAVMLADVFGTYGLYQHYPTPWGPPQNVTYISLSRLGWAAGLSVIAFLCFSQQIPMLNAFLSFQPFEILGKLTYAAYIVHPLIVSGIAYGASEPVKFSNAWYASAYTSYVVWATCIALVLWLLVEKPSANLLALALSHLGLSSSG